MPFPSPCARRILLPAVGGGAAELMMKQHLRRRRLRALAAFLFLASLAPVAALTVQWKLYRQNLTVDLPSMPRPVRLNPARRLLVIAPHPDDETLGCGGVIARAARDGVPVAVVFVTQGDGSRATAAREFKRLQPRPAQLIAMGRMRQEEARAALTALGVSGDALHFLGYPDGGIDELWRTHWGEAQPYRSPFTQTDHNPYPNSETPEAPYCGEALLRDLRALLVRLRPTEVYVTDPLDTHGDHWATHAFTVAALEGLGQRPRLWTYLIHRDGGLAETLKFSWPAPIGLHPQEPLTPPRQLLATNTRWQQEAMSPDLVEQKLRAIHCYRSQLGPYEKFMLSFARTNELFGTTDPAAATAPLIVDSAQDGFARDLVPAGDVQSVDVRPVGDELQIDLALFGRPSPRVRYEVELTGVTAERVVREVVVLPSTACPEDDTHALRVVVPRARVRAEALLVVARTRLGKIKLDQTALRVARMPPAAAGIGAGRSAS